jgi:DNA-binding beta-propeller fold protein YncE
MFMEAFMRFVIFFLMLAPQAYGASLKKVGQIELPGPAGKRFDYLTIDYVHHRLLSAHLGAGLLDIIDLKSNQLLSTIKDLPGIEGVEYVPELNKAYTSNWNEQKIGVVDLNSMKISTKLPASGKPDGSTYAADFHKLYVSDETAKQEIIIDVRTDTVLKVLHFESETGMPQYDPVSKMVYLNLQDQNRLALIDPANDEVKAYYEVGKCKGNHGMALDSMGQRLFLACEGNNLMTVFDLRSHKPTDFLPMASGGDVIKYDVGLKRVYVACYSGAISIFQDRGGLFKKLEDFQVQPKVHSLAVDSENHRVYAPEQEEDGKPVSRMIIYDAL